MNKYNTEIARLNRNIEAKGIQAEWNALQPYIGSTDKYYRQQGTTLKPVSLGEVQESLDKPFYAFKPQEAAAIESGKYKVDAAGGVTIYDPVSAQSKMPTYDPTKKGWQQDFVVITNPGSPDAPVATFRMGQTGTTFGEFNTKMEKQAVENKQKMLFGKPDQYVTLPVAQYGIKTSDFLSQKIPTNEYLLQQSSKFGSAGGVAYGFASVGRGVVMAGTELPRAMGSVVLGSEYILRHPVESISTTIPFAASVSLPQFAEHVKKNPLETTGMMIAPFAVTKLISHAPVPAVIRSSIEGYKVSLKAKGATPDQKATVFSATRIKENLYGEKNPVANKMDFSKVATFADKKSASAIEGVIKGEPHTVYGRSVEISQMPKELFEARGGTKDIDMFANDIESFNKRAISSIGTKNYNIEGNTIVSKVLGKTAIDTHEFPEGYPHKGVSPKDAGGQKSYETVKSLFDTLPKTNKDLLTIEGITEEKLYIQAGRKTATAVGQYNEGTSSLINFAERVSGKTLMEKVVDPNRQIHYEPTTKIPVVKDVVKVLGTKDVYQFGVKHRYKDIYDTLRYTSYYGSEISKRISESKNPLYKLTEGIKYKQLEKDFNVIKEYWGKEERVMGPESEKLGVVDKTKGGLIDAEEYLPKIQAIKFADLETMKGKPLPVDSGSEPMLLQPGSSVYGKGYSTQSNRIYKYSSPSAIGAKTTSPIPSSISRSPLSKYTSPSPSTSRVSESSIISKASGYGIPSNMGSKLKTVSGISEQSGGSKSPVIESVSTSTLGRVRSPSISSITSRGIRKSPSPSISISTSTSSSPRSSITTSLTPYTPPSEPPSSPYVFTTPKQSKQIPKVDDTKRKPKTIKRKQKIGGFTWKITNPVPTFESVGFTPLKKTGKKSRKRIGGISL